MQLLSRDEFREKVLARDNHKCVICSDLAADAHHIIDRRLWADEGYYLDNGASLCPPCHIKAETTVLSCEELRSKAGILKPLIPSELGYDETYDKWGNVILPSGMRVKGELFFDESVQKILAMGNVLDQFTEYIKFPKIYHLPWSLGITNDDRVMTENEINENFNGKKIVITEKMDGENTSCYTNYLHARSLDGRNHPSRNWLKAFHAQWSFNIPEGWRVCGENLYAKHSILYNNLPSYFLVFAIYNEKNVCLSYPEMKEYCELLGLKSVPIIYEGPYNKDIVRKCFTGKSLCGGEQEGYVVRLFDSIEWSKHKKSFEKFVRKDHVKTSHNWMMEKMIINGMKNEII
jgi:hypothetical protein